MYLVGQRVETVESGVIYQGYIDEVTDHGEVVISMLSTTKAEVVRDYYPPSSTDFRVCRDQSPQLGDLTRFGLIRGMTQHADGIIECHFNDATGKAVKEWGIWLSDERMAATSHEDIPEYEDCHWIKGDYYNQVLEAFHLQNGVYGVEPKPLLRLDIPSECVLEAVLEDGSMKQFTASIGDSRVIDDIEVDDGKNIVLIDNILDLKKLGVTRANFIATYEVEEFDSIR